MSSLFLQLLPLAIVCALSPWALVAVILMLASDRPSNSVWWLAGWVLSTFAIGALIILVFNGFDYSPSTTAGKGSYIVQVSLGVLLLVAASRFWSRRPARTGKLPAEPSWMKKIGTMSPLWAFLIGAFWINSALVVAAAVDTLQADLPSGESMTAFAVFTLATATVQGALILYAYCLPKHAAIGLERIRDWIARNQEVALAIVAFVLAIWLATQGLAGLLG